MKERILGLVTLLACAAAAAVQLNDPDPFRWFTFYAMGTLVGTMAAFGRLWRPYALGYAVLGFGIAATHLGFGVEGLGSDWIEHELVREGLGAAIAGALSTALYVVTPDRLPPRHQRSSDTQP